MSSGAGAMDVLQLQVRSWQKAKSIHSCCWRVMTFLERDAYAAYDVECGLRPEDQDQLERRHLRAINDAMRARSSVAAWQPFIDQPLAELGRVPRDLCLVRGEEAPVQAGIDAIGEVVERLGSVRGITDMAVSKMLFLLRPKFVAISDSYVRNALGISNGEAPSPGPGRGHYVRSRFVEVMQAMRKLGQANLPLLTAIEARLSTLGAITISPQCQNSARRWVGRQLPVRVAPVRILDILLWTEAAIFGSQADWNWRKWAEQAGVARS